MLSGLKELPSGSPALHMDKLGLRVAPAQIARMKPANEWRLKMRRIMKTEYQPKNLMYRLMEPILKRKLVQISGSQVRNWRRFFK